jgi:hypothetical protein
VGAGRMEPREVRVADERQHYQAGCFTTCCTMPPSTM